MGEGHEKAYLAEHAADARLSCGEGTDDMRPRNRFMVDATISPQSRWITGKSWFSIPSALRTTETDPLPLLPIGCSLRYVESPADADKNEKEGMGFETTTLSKSRVPNAPFP